LESVLENTVQEWRRFLKHSVTGRRFRDRYHRRQQAGRDRPRARRACYVAFGVAIAIGSLILAPLPGPGLGTVSVGLGIVAGEVLRVAQILDRAEVNIEESAATCQRRVGQVCPCGEDVGRPDDFSVRLGISLRSLPLTPWPPWIR
jgi:hypothetical protein